ncbi:amino acid ABC transporter permease [Candidatus Bipolaricaulota bacterium]|nr:amino acid ABC transporter permease [Candidatus Bipolaricaulota bacterium]
MFDFWELSSRFLPQLLLGARVTLELTSICIAGGLILGWGLALGRVYGGRIVYSLCTAYVELVRGTPLLVQLFMLYYGLPDVGIVLPPLLAAGVALGMNTAAYQAEYFRGAIQAVPKGQVQAARALGMGRWQAVWYVVLPQAVRLVIPAWSNELIYMLKYSSLAFIVGVPELMGRANLIAARNFRYFEIYLVVAVIYVALVGMLAGLLGWLERKTRLPGLERWL